MRGERPVLMHCHRCRHLWLRREDTEEDAESCSCHCHDTYKFVVLGRPWRTPVSVGAPEQRRGTDDA